MIGLNVLQNQWLILALFGGSATVLAVFLCYLAGWRPRQGTDQAGNRSPVAWTPWGLIVVYALTVAFGLAFVVMVALNPPNW